MHKKSPFKEAQQKFHQVLRSHSTMAFFYYSLSSYYSVNPEDPVAGKAISGLMEYADKQKEGFINGDYAIDGPQENIHRVVMSTYSASFDFGYSVAKNGPDAQEQEQYQQTMAVYAESLRDAVQVVCNDGKHAQRAVKLLESLQVRARERGAELL